MIYVGTMAGRFSGYSSELGNAQSLAALQADLGDEKGREIFDQLFWNEDPKAPTTVPEGAQYQRKAAADRPHDLPAPPASPSCWAARICPRTSCGPAPRTCGLPGRKRPPMAAPFWSTGRNLAISTRPMCSISACMARALT